MYYQTQPASTSTSSLAQFKVINWPPSLLKALRSARTFVFSRSTPSSHSRRSSHTEVF